MIALRIVVGLVLFGAGVGVMSTIPPVDSATPLVVGWALMLAGLAVATPAALDALGVD